MDDLRQSLVVYMSQPADVAANACGFFEFMKSGYEALQKMRSDEIIKSPPYRKYARRFADRKLLVLDLDETLIHGTENPIRGSEFDHSVDIQKGEKTVTAYYNVRPYTRCFLECVS